MLAKFNHIDESLIQGMIPVKDDIFFRRFQIPLLRLINTREGRDLLCINSDYPEIVSFRKNCVVAYLGQENGKDYFLNDFRVGCKWANVIRHRWKEFALALKKFYKDKDGFLQPVIFDEKSGLYKAAAATDTFYPDPDPETTTVDGRVFYNYGASQGTWAAGRGAAVGNGVQDSAATAPCGTISTGSLDWSGFTRGFALYDTAILGDGISIHSGSVGITPTTDDPIVDDFSRDLSLVDTNPTSNTELVVADYAIGTKVGTTKQAPDIPLANFSHEVEGRFALDATGLNGINKTGITKHGFAIDSDIDNVEPSFVANKKSTLKIHYAEETGITDDINMQVVSSIPTKGRRGFMSRFMR